MIKAKIAFAMRHFLFTIISLFQKLKVQETTYRAFLLRETSRKARKSRFDFKRKAKQFDNTLDDGSDAEYSRMSCLTFGITKSLNARGCYLCFAKLFRFYIRIAKHEIRNFILNSFHKSYFLSLSHVNCSRRIIFLFYVQ